MSCYICKEDLLSDDKILKCGQCLGKFHLRCLNNITDTNFDYILSSTTLWKCNVCLEKKGVRDDDRPLTPTSLKSYNLPTKKLSGSDIGSDSSSKSESVKVACKKCLKGFAYNAYKITCITCKSNYHLKCSEFNSKDDYVKLKHIWQCGLCKQERPPRSRVQSTSDKAASEVLSSETGMLSDILAEMRSFRNEVRQTNKEFKDSMDKYAEWITENSKKIDEVVNNIRDLTVDFDYIKQENLNLKKTVKELNTKLENLEQNIKENEIEIQGVPFVKSENLFQILENISTVIGFKFEASNISKCYRFNAQGRASGGIFVRFVRNIDAELFIQKRREKRNLNSRDLGFQDGDASVIYINCSLTPSKRKLLREARQFRKEKQFTFIWVKGGRIFLRKDQGSRAIEVKDTDDLDKIK